MGGTFVGLNSHIMDGFDSVLNGMAATTGGWMGYLFSISTISLYLTWRGYQMMAGKLARPFEEIVWDVSRMLIIMIFVTNAGGYLDLVTDAINGLRDGVSGGTSIWERLDTVWEKAQKLGEDLFNKDDSRYVPAKGLFAQGLVWGGVSVLVGLTAIINIIAELMLRLMLATAPLFIFCLMWSWFRDMFNSWLKVILSSILTTYFSGIALKVVMDYLDYILNNAKGANDANYLTLGVQVMLGALGAASVMMLCYKLADSLAGASAQGAAQALASAGMGKAARPAAKAAGKGAELAGKGAGKAVEAARDIAGAIGDKALEHLRGAGGSMESKRKAAIERMIERYK
ncbi:type IV secretion system protein [Enterobacter cloacae]|uniref:type IV secretion system protein n=1 Tax=Enterobacter cloacae TaxID=550 RepID=UPI002FF8B5CC